MTEKEFLKKRTPFWFEDDDLKIIIPSNMDKMDVHCRLSRKYNYNWMHVIRGYYWPGSHVMLYKGEYETPNVTVMVCQYLFNYFSDISWIGLGCHIGEKGEIWEPKVTVVRNKNMIKDEVLHKQTEESV